MEYFRFRNYAYEIRKEIQSDGTKDQIPGFLDRWAQKTDLRRNEEVLSGRNIFHLDYGTKKIAYILMRTPQIYSKIRVSYFVDFFIKLPNAKMFID